MIRQAQLGCLLWLSWWSCGCQLLHSKLAQLRGPRVKLLISLNGAIGTLIIQSSFGSHDAALVLVVMVEGAFQRAFNIVIDAPDSVGLEFGARATEYPSRGAAEYGGPTGKIIMLLLQICHLLTSALMVLVNVIEGELRCDGKAARVRRLQTGWRFPTAHLRILILRDDKSTSETR